MPRRRADPLEWLTRAPIPGMARCRIPDDLDAVIDVGWEDPGGSDVARERVERVWERVVALYRTGVHPALQICIRRDGCVVLHRAIGHARGNAPQDPPDGPRVPLTTASPFNIFSASKAITAMVIHKLDEERVLHLEDRVCDFIPEFAQPRQGPHHAAPHPGAQGRHPEPAARGDRPRPAAAPGAHRVRSCATRGCARGPGACSPTTRSPAASCSPRWCGAPPATTSAACSRSASSAPLGFRWMRYGVAPADLPLVVQDALTGPPVPPPISRVLRNALGAARCARS